MRLLFCCIFHLFGWLWLDWNMLNILLLFITLEDRFGNKPILFVWNRKQSVMVGKCFLFKLKYTSCAPRDGLNISNQKKNVKYLGRSIDGKTTTVYHSVCAEEKMLGIIYTMCKRNHCVGVGFKRTNNSLVHVYIPWCIALTKTLRKKQQVYSNQK